MADTPHTQRELVSAVSERRPKQFLWGTEHVPWKPGAGALFEKLGWLNAQLGDGRVFPLRDTDRFWSRDDDWLGPREAALVAAYFLFESKMAMDAFVSELEGSLPVTAELWLSPPRSGDEDLQSCSLLVLFDGLEPLRGPMSRIDVLRAVQHYLGWCFKRATGATNCWRHAIGGFTELVPLEWKARWFAARQAWLLPCGEPRRLMARSFTCRTPCRD